MEFKIVISDPKSRRSHQQEVKDERAKKFMNLSIGSEFDGSIIGLTGYKLLITGGSDKGGFPMRKGVHGTSRPKLLLTGGVGYNPVSSIRRRKRVRGEVILEDIVQINTKIIGYGKKSIEELLGFSKQEDKPEGEKPQEKPGEEKPKEKPKEEKPQEKPKEVKPAEKPEKSKEKQAKPQTEGKEEKKNKEAAK